MKQNKCRVVVCHKTFETQLKSVGIQCIFATQLRALLDRYKEKTALKYAQQIAFIHIRASRTEMLALGVWNRSRKQLFGEASHLKLTWLTLICR